MPLGELAALDQEALQRHRESKTYSVIPSVTVSLDRYEPTHLVHGGGA